MNNPDLRPVFRCHFRGLLAAEPAPAQLETIKAEAAAAIRAGRLMTAACYRFGSELFLFCEALGEPCSPEALLPAFKPLLAPWPQNGELRRWAVMYNIYWHSVPKNAADWRRPAPPALRRGFFPTATTTPRLYRRGFCRATATTRLRCMKTPSSAILRNPRRW